MNVEREQNVAKTSRENEELMKKGKLNWCLIQELQELWSPSSSVWGGLCRILAQMCFTDMLLVAAELDTGRISADDKNLQQKRSPRGDLMSVQPERHFWASGKASFIWH